MKRVAAFAGLIAVLSLGAACGRGGVTIASAPRDPAAVQLAAHLRAVERYCDFEAYAVGSLERFRADGVSPLAAEAAFRSAAAAASQAAAAAPEAIEPDATDRSRILTAVWLALRESRYDAGSAGPDPSSLTESPEFLGAVDRIAAYDSLVCGIVKG
jgi:hypothetical protein